MFQKQHAQNIQVNSQITQAHSQLSSAIDKFSTASTSLKIDQPLFKPVGSYEDFMKFKEWKRHYGIFIKRIGDDKWDEKLNWLKASVFRQAANIIFACAATQAGYDEAIQLLKEKYENIDVVREAYIEWVHTFKVVNVGKNYINVSKGLVQLRNYVKELEECYATAWDPKILGHIILKALPIEFRKRITAVTKKLYPTSTEIFAKYEEAINTLNVYQNSQLSLATDHKKQAPETKSQNLLTNKKSSYANKGKGNFGSNKVLKCMFCKNEKLIFLGKFCVNSQCELGDLF